MTSHEDNVDHDEHRYWSNQCPACDGPASQCQGHGTGETGEPVVTHRVT